MVGIVVPKTYWAYKKYNKIISSISLDFILQLTQWCTVQQTSKSLLPFGTTCHIYVSFEKQCNGAVISLCPLWCCRDSISLDAVAPDACSNVGSIFSVNRSSHRHVIFFLTFTENQVMIELQKPSFRRSYSAYLKKMWIILNVCICRTYSGCLCGWYIT